MGPRITQAHRRGAEPEGVGDIGCRQVAPPSWPRRWNRPARSGLIGSMPDCASPRRAPVRPRSRDRAGSGVRLARRPSAGATGEHRSIASAPDAGQACSPRSPVEATEGWPLSSGAWVRRRSGQRPSPKVNDLVIEELRNRHVRPRGRNDQELHSFGFPGCGRWPLVSAVHGHRPARETPNEGLRRLQPRMGPIPVVEVRVVVDGTAHQLIEI